MMDSKVEESLIEPGHFGDSTDNIIIIKDFVSPLDLEHMAAFLPHLKQWDNPKETEYNEDGVCIYDASYWWDRVCEGRTLNRVNPFVYDMIANYTKKMAHVIEDKFGVAVYTRDPVLVRWLPECEQEPHADKQLNDGSPNPFPTYDINSIIYWNDDFEGGQFYYPDHGIELEIEAGMAVAHPGDINYLHGVKPVVSGVRWTTPSFYTITSLNTYGQYAFGD
jgi:hypothetical protein